MKSLLHINKTVQTQKELPLPLPPTPSPFLSGVTPTKPGTSIFSFRDRVFTYAMSLIDDYLNVIRDMIQTNGMYTLLDTMRMYFKDVEDIDCRVKNTRQTLNTAATNRLKMLKSLSIHS